MSKLLEKLKDYKQTNEVNTILVCFRSRVFNDELLPILKEVLDSNITILADNIRSIDIIKRKLKINKINLNIKYIIIEEYLNGEIKMKFDYIVGNPPYEGTRELLQQIFNKSVDMLKDNGIINFIQPAFPYHTKKKPKKHTKRMQDIIKKYHTDVVIEAPSLFKNAAIATDLAVTTLTKTEDAIINVTYKNGDKYKKINLDDITML